DDGRVGTRDPTGRGRPRRADRRAPYALAELPSRMIRARAMLRAACAAAVLLPALLCSAVRAEVANRIVATIDGEPVTAHELRRYAKEHGIGGEPEARVLETLITDKLLEKEIKAQG